MSLVSSWRFGQAQAMLNGSDFKAALDERHFAASRAFAAKDIGAYQALFSENLQYSPVDGKVIDRERLMRNVRAQFKTLQQAQSRFAREDSIVVGDEVEETLLQIAVAEAAAFGFVRRLWRIERRGRYTWAMEDGQFRIVRVRVSSEKVEGRWRFGRSLTASALEAFLQDGESLR